LKEIIYRGVSVLFVGILNKFHQVIEASVWCMPRIIPFPSSFVERDHFISSRVIGGGDLVGA